MAWAEAGFHTVIRVCYGVAIADVSNACMRAVVRVCYGVAIADVSNALICLLWRCRSVLRHAAREDKARRKMRGQLKQPALSLNQTVT